MTMKSKGWLAAALILAVAGLPLSAGAQDKPPEKDKKPAAAPAKPAAPPAARPSPPPQQHQAAPPQQRQAPPPRQAAPPPQRQAPPPQRQAVPPQQRQAPPPQQRQAAPPRPQPPAAAQRQEQRQERVQQRQQQQQQSKPSPQRQQAAPSQPAPQNRQAVQPNSAPAQTAAPAKTPAQQRVQQRQQQRQERVTRQREDRELRRLPASQRAQRREEINRNRAQRAQQAQQPALSAQPNAAAQRNAAPSAAARSGPRRNGQARVTTQAARQGRFASSFAAARTARAGSANVAAVRVVRDHPRRAWQRGLRAGFVPWFGPVFWPYAYSDIFDYTFWPGGYDDAYWSYAYDDFFDGVFWGEAGPPEEFVEAEPGMTAPAAAPQASYAAVQNLCKQPGSGVTAWPFADIEKKVGLSDEQKTLLSDVRKAAADAAASFKASCPPENAFPLTPPGRLQTMRARLNATLEAVQAVRPALEKFYASLSDEQKERFNQIGPKPEQASAEARDAQDTKSCKEPKQGLSNLPIESIEDAVKPTDAQAAKLDALEKATGEGVALLQAACPEDTPLTPPGRLEAMEKRLQAMVDAADAVKPALEDFYASLSAEQKARFNRIGRSLAAADTKQ